MENKNRIRKYNEYRELLEIRYSELVDDRELAGLILESGFFPWVEPVELLLDLRDAEKRDWWISHLAGEQAKEKFLK